MSSGDRRQPTDAGRLRCMSRNVKRMSRTVNHQATVAASDLAGAKRVGTRHDLIDVQRATARETNASRTG